MSLKFSTSRSVTTSPISVGINLPPSLLHVLPLLDGAEDRRVGGRASDAALFQLFHQRGFVVARRRLGEVLLRLQFFQRELLAFFKGRQLVLERLIFFVLTLPSTLRKPSGSRRISAPIR